MEHKQTYPKKAPIHLEYELSPEQKELSNKLVENYKKGIDSLVFAVCGSGKTGIILSSIHYCLTNNLHVGFCVPRRDVAIDLFDRFKNIFKDNSIALVYGGHDDIINGDIICCTTHQLYRYKAYFDLLIIDEVDAFPFNGNETLNSMFYRAIKGNYIMLSATVKEEDLIRFEKEGGKVFRLNQRFHRYPLPVPYVKTGIFPFLFYYVYRLNRLFQKQGKKVFIFAPTIKECEILFRFLHLFQRDGNYVHSKRKNREQIIGDFKNGKYRYLVTTSILERGVTVKDLQVIVFDASHKIYSSEALVQISGRVGRKKDAPEGRVIYVARYQNNSIKNSIAIINTSNKDLQNLF